MALYTLERDMDLPEDDPGMENTMFRVVGSSFLCQVRWMRSYVRVPSDRILGFCVYESPGTNNLQRAANSCRVPYVALAEVEELLAPGVGRGADRIPEGQSLLLVERTFPRGWNAAALRDANECVSRADGVAWLRSYWDPAARRARCIFGAAARDVLTAALGEHATETRISDAESNHPSAWARMYDSYDLPYHWEEPEQHLDREEVEPRHARQLSPQS